MSRLRGLRMRTVSRFPRVSGDEPCLGSKMVGITLFSPRERG